MQMDYDDNDNSHHNLQLAGEGRARSSSALRPYDFPKFDFVDSLQGHIRFDSLVETEVFLGIQSQEDNQWIEDFSRGTNGMEFNSTPTDSCSISRRNNVWSEATSSESVEMLLKSVGHDEMMAGVSIRQVSDATADLGTLSKLVESSNNKLKERNDSHGANSDTKLPQDMEEQLVNPSASLAKVDSRNTCNLNQNDMCGNDGTLTDEGKRLYHDESTSEILEASKESVEKTMGERDSLCFQNIVDHADASIGMLSTSKPCQQTNSSISHESCIDDGQDKYVSSEVELKDAVILQGKTGVTSVHTCSAGSSLGFVSDSRSESLETNLDCGGLSEGNIVKGEFELKSFEGDHTNISFKTTLENMRPENDLAVSNVMGNLIDNCQGGSSKDVIVQHSAEFGSISSGQCTSPEHLLDPLPHGQDNDDMDDMSVNPSKFKSVSEISLLSMDANEPPTAMGKGIGKASHEYSKKTEGCLKDTIATGEDSIANLLADDMDVTMQVIQDNLDHRRADSSQSEKDMCKTTVADKEGPGVLENMDSKKIGTLTNDPKTQSLEIREGFNVDTVNHEVNPQTCGKLESANNVSTLTNIKASTASAGHLEVGQSEPSAIGLLPPHNYQEEVGKTDANLRVEVDTASKDGVSVADDAVQIPISEISAMSQQAVEKTDDICSSVPSSKEAQYSLSLDCKQSSPKENVDLTSGRETLAKEEDKEFGQTADIDKISCGSPTIISSSTPSQPENDNQEENRGCEITDEAKGIPSTSEDLERMDLLGDDGGFTFKVDALPDTVDREPGKNWCPFPDVQKSKVLEETAPSGKGKSERKISRKTPRQNARLLDGETGSGSSKSTSERKGRRGSAKGTTKEKVKKGNQSKSPTQMQHYGNVEATNKKPLGVAVPTSNLPDLTASALNSMASSSPTLRQPFSDSQQVQLRAQIFVYGSLIQGHVPDEACMTSAFGKLDGGHNFWERTWRAAAERIEKQKSTATAAETPSSHSGARTTDAVKQVPTTPESKTNSKDTPAAVLSPITPQSSPLWNISTPSRDSLSSNPMHKGPIADFQQALVPGHPFQTPSIRNYVGYTSWPSQTGFPGPWLASPQTSSFSTNVQFRPVTMTETVKLTPVKSTSAMLTSIGKHTTFNPAVHVASPSPALGRVSPLHDAQSMTLAAQQSVDAKPRKRKKKPASDPVQVTFVSEALTGSNVASLPIIPAGASITPLTSNTIMSKPAADYSTVSSIALPKESNVDVGKGSACSEETLIKVSEAKIHAEDAAELAVAAVTHCEDLWVQLAKQKDTGWTSETEAKLASSAVAIAAAASVAKAAAAAAKIASNAALQAKLMADEAFFSNKICGVSCNEKSPSDIHDAGNATPASVSKKSNSLTNQSSSILDAAKKASKRTVEAASAASIQAENLDAIVKAAELAAAAVSQAGNIVAMGEPLPLNDLIEAGPEGYWKLPQPFVVLTEKTRDKNIDPVVSSDKTSGMPACIPLGVSVEKEGPGVVGKDDVHFTEGPGGLSKTLPSQGVLGSKHTDEMDFRSGAASSAAFANETFLRTSNVKHACDDIAVEAVDGIKEGSYVEVFNPRIAQKSAWYTANVLSVEKGKIFVSYNDLSSKEGSGNCQEWVSIVNDGDKAPVIRAAQPLSSLRYQQTGKRTRAALGDYVWCVGDRVDVWIDDCWWEGVVIEKNEKDETTLKVHISAQGETQTVRAWNLRASRSWINGKWIECVPSKGQKASEERQEKRQKLGSPVFKSKDTAPNSLNSTLQNPEQSKILTLSTNEIRFDVGKSTSVDDDKHALRRPLRTNLQKEGSRVVFGVPKPSGKKQKFMEVSKHFPANKTDKSNEANDSVKFAKYLLPRGAPSQGWKVPTRNDSKDKQMVESRPRVSTRKGQRNLPQRENTRSKLAEDADTIDRGNHLEENTSDKSADHGSAESTETPLSALLPHSLSASAKKISSSNFKSYRLNRGRLGPSGGKLSKIEEDKVCTANTGKSLLDVSEPRRSNRQIQPTHRLLEGLQSSMAIPKMPAVSLDRSRRKLPARGKRL